MALSIGIVGLPNVGKSTLFNALLKKQQAYVANFPFATIEPNVGIVPVPDERLERLAELIKVSEGLDSLPPVVPATVKFVDIAGLIAGAHQGAGLGNKFLAHIREVEAICHVVRAFRDENIIKEGSVDPVRDFQTVETELLLADLQTIEKQSNPGNVKDEKLKKRWQTILKLKQALARGVPLRKVELIEEEREILKELYLLTAKPILIVLNVDEEDLKEAVQLERDYAPFFQVEPEQIITISAKIEAELASLPEREQKQYLSSLGLASSSLERLIKKAFSVLGLITFLTAGEKEIRAWTIRRGVKLPQAAGVIHSDFEKNFIRAEVIDWQRLVEAGGWQKAKERGWVRIEGKDYVVQDGEVVIVKHSA